jgi:hypothetical protein
MSGALMEVTPLLGIFLRLSIILICFHLRPIFLRLSIFALPFFLRVVASLSLLIL